MPVYEYKCESCGEVFERIQKFSDEPVKVHEKCGGAVHRLLSAPALQFKGSGWYVTDYAKGNGGASHSTKNESSSPSDSTSSKKDSGTSSDSGSASKTPTQASPDKKS